MLKRNGEDCEHPVPNYPGLLTASEFKAYNVQSPGIAEQVTSQIARDLPSLTVMGKPESEWKIRHVLFKSSRSEMLFCSREHEGEQQFGVVEKFDPQSPFARVHGDTDLQMTGNNAFVLLQNYVESERSVLQLFRKDIEATVEENLSEKLPNQNHSRVVRAISARCGSQALVENEKEKPAKSVKIRM